jgi:D-arabinose 1-dehydrogenase-like Zn-dependent alcohol dehydrogenase
MTDESIISGDARARADRWSVAIVVAVFVVSLLLPPGCLDRLPALCTMRRLTGLPCPGCGMTHAFVAIAHGHWDAALHYNAMAYPLFAAGLVYLGLRAWEAARGRRVAIPGRAVTLVLWAYAIGLMVYGAYRIMVPGARPF